MRINLGSPWFERCAIGKWSCNLGFLALPFSSPDENVPTLRGGCLVPAGIWLPSVQHGLQCSRERAVPTIWTSSTIAASMPTTPSIVLHDSPNAPRPGRRNTELIVTLFSRPKMFHSQSQLCIIKLTHFWIFPDLIITTKLTKRTLP